MPRSAFMEMVAHMHEMMKGFVAPPPTPRERAAGEVVDRYLVLRDEQTREENGWPTQRLYLRFPDFSATAEQEIAEGTSLRARRDYLRLLLVALVMEAAPIVSGLPENPLPVKGTVWDRLRLNPFEDPEVDVDLSELSAPHEGSTPAPDSCPHTG